MRCVMPHAWTPKFQLSGPTVHSLYCGADLPYKLTKVNHMFEKYMHVIYWGYLTPLFIVCEKPSCPNDLKQMEPHKRSSRTSLYSTHHALLASKRLFRHRSYVSFYVSLVLTQRQQVTANDLTDTRLNTIVVIYLIRK